jgi:hypothetical protein
MTPDILFEWSMVILSIFIVIFGAGVLIILLISMIKDLIFEN